MDSISSVLIQQEIISAIVTNSVIYAVLPAFGVAIGGVVLHALIGRKSAKVLVDDLEEKIGIDLKKQDYDLDKTKEIISSKVSQSLHDDSIKRVHEKREQGDSILHNRINEDRDKNHVELRKISGILGKIEGNIEVMRKNGKGHHE